jgi:hypothetical protein
MVFERIAKWWPEWRNPAWRRANLIWCPLLALASFAVLVITQPPAQSVRSQLTCVALIWCLGYIGGMLVQKALDDHKSA